MARITRFLVQDVYEIKKRFNFDAEKIKSYIRSEYGV